MVALYRRSNTWTDATAANDPDSLALLLPSAAPDERGARPVLIYNHRDDRVPRLPASPIVRGAFLWPSGS